MKGTIERLTVGIKRVKGIEIQIKGRLKGADRKQKKVIIPQRSQLNQQDRWSQIEQASSGINTKFGTLGVRVKRAVETVTPHLQGRDGGVIRYSPIRTRKSAAEKKGNGRKIKIIVNKEG